MHYVIGDIHGQLPALKLLLQKINYDPQADSLYFLGDYVDWGPASVGVIQYICRLQEENAKIAKELSAQEQTTPEQTTFDNKASRTAVPQVCAILGNHDLMMLKTIKHPLSMRKPFCYENNWYYNRGEETFRQFRALDPEEQKKIQQWLEYLPVDLTIEVEGTTYVLAHGVPQNMAPEDGHFSKRSMVEQAVWTRGDYVRNLQPEITLIRGHEITKSLKIEFWSNNIINVDCGAKAIGVLHGEPYKLACLRLEDREEFYVSKEDLA